MSQEQGRARLEQARAAREEAVMITHRCGHVMKHPVISKLGVGAYVRREEARLCVSCVRMEQQAFSWSAIEAKKAVYRQEMETAAVHLAAMEILQAEGGVLPALELVIRVIAYFNNVSKDARVMCKEMGFAVDEVIDIARFLV